MSVWINDGGRTGVSAGGRCDFAAESTGAEIIGHPPPTKWPRGAPAASEGANPLLSMQRPIGNQAVQRLLHARANSPEVGSDTAGSPPTIVRSETRTTTRFAHDFSRIAVHAPAAVTIQAKLAVNTTGDVYEQEADHFAERAMRMSEPQLQSDCVCGEKCSASQTEDLGQRNKRVQPKNVGSTDSTQTAALPLVHEVLASPGQPLDASVRA